MVKIRVINICKASHLPEEGWLQGCYICSSVTGRTISHEPPEVLEDTKIIVYMCPFCQKLKGENNELDNVYSDLINSYIYRNFV